MNTTDLLLADLLADLASIAGQAIPPGAHISALILDTGQTLTFGRITQ